MSVFSSAALVIDDTGHAEATTDAANQRFGSGSGERVFLMGSEFKLIGNSSGPDGFNMPASGNSSVIVIGSPTLTVSQPSGGHQTIMKMNQTRPANGFTMLVRGQNLGVPQTHVDNTDPMNPVTVVDLDNEITNSTVTAQVASGPSTPIIPWAYGDNSETGGGSDLVTYGANGFAPLNSSQYDASGSLPGSAVAENFKITGDQNPLADSSLNALVVTSGNLNLGNTTLTVTTGVC